MLSVAEGTIVLILCQVVGVCLLGDILHSHYPSAPTLTVNILSSSAIAPVLTIFYLWLRTKCLPKFVLNREALLTAISGMVLVFIVSLLYVMIFKYNTFVKNLLSSPGNYKEINIFLFVIWGPLLEEVLFRGYILNLLKSYGKITALLITSILFATLHLLFAGFSIDLYLLVESIFLVIYAMIYGVCYLNGGIVSAILAHVFCNLYFLVANS